MANSVTTIWSLKINGENWMGENLKINGENWTGERHWWYGDQVKCARLCSPCARALWLEASGFSPRLLKLLNFSLFSIFESWLHSQGVVELYSKIADQGYAMMFLTNRWNIWSAPFPYCDVGLECFRAIGQSEMTANYIRSLKEGSYKMPSGPVLLQVLFSCPSWWMVNGAGAQL